MIGSNVLEQFYPSIWMDIALAASAALRGGRPDRPEARSGLVGSLSVLVEQPVRLRRAVLRG